MKSSTILLVGVTLLALSLQVPTINAQFSYTIDYVRKLILGLSELVQKSFAIAVNLIADDLIGLEEFIKGFVSNFNVGATKLVGRVVAEITILSAKAAGNAVDITSCNVGVAIAELEAMPAILTSQLTKCIAPVFATAKEYAVQGQTRLNATSAVIASLSDKAEKCGGDITCLMSISLEIPKLSLKIPLELTSIAAETINLILGLNSDVLQCSTSAFAKLNTETLAIARKVTACLTSI